MNIPSRRKLGAIALILAGIAAVGVPLYLYHGGSSPQGTSPNPTTTTGNNNNNNGNTASNTNHNTNTNSNTGHSPGNGGDSGSNTGEHDEGSGSSNSCSDPKSTDSDPSGASSHTQSKDNDNDQGKENHNGNAFGVLKNKMDTTVALVKSMGAHNSAFHEHHDTKTDNHTVHDEPEGVGHDSISHDPSCDSSEDDNDTD